ncbi:MAG: dienelactone hydrolase family protein [Nannocystaceae bacterium]
MRRALCLSAALLALACSPKTSSTTPPSEDAAPTTKAPADNVPASTGPLTEAEFKALHELPEDAPADRKGETLTLPGGAKAYLSLPPGPGPHPGIVVIHEWWGLNGHIERWADRLASAGWAALAVDLYGGAVATDRDGAMAAMKAVEPAKAIAVIGEGLRLLAEDPRIKAPVRATIGWCFGGGYSLQAAQAFPELDGAILYYGRFEADPAKLKPIHARLVGVFGDRDQGIPPAEVDKFEAALHEAGVSAEIHHYDADHAFANPSNPKYDEANAGDAWGKVLVFLDALRKG